VATPRGLAGNAACRATTLMDQSREMTLWVCSLRARRAFGATSGASRRRCEGPGQHPAVRGDPPFDLIGQFSAERRELVSFREEGLVTATTRVARTVLPTMSTARALASPPARSLAPGASTRRRDARARLARGRSLMKLLPRGPKLTRVGPAAGVAAAAAAAASDDDAASSVAETSDDEADADRRRREAEDRANLQDRLRTSMEAAARAEDFELAARLRDELNEALERDECHVAKRELAAAIEEERFEDAAALRDLVASLEPPPPPPPAEVPCHSDVTTEGVNVRVMSQYVASRSRPESGQYFFAYSVRITNRTEKIVQLRRRRWIITDGDERVEEVAGPGVVGQQPVLLPGQTFEYASACPLRTRTGTMEGTYTFAWLVATPAVELEDGDGEDGGGDGSDEKEEAPPREEDARDMDEFSTALTFLREGEQSEFMVEIGLFGLDADAGASTQ